jgi:hypothetical protein
MTEMRKRMSRAELDAESGTMLPAKEVVSLLDLFLNVDVALDLAAPIDLAVAGNLNAAAPIQGAVSANILSFGSGAQGQSLQLTQITQHITGDTHATAPQTASIDQSNDVIDPGTTGTTDPGTTGTTDPGTTGTTDPGTTGTTDPGTTGTTDPGTTGTTDPGTTGTTDPGTTGTTDPGTTGTGAVTDVTQSGMLNDGLLDVNVDINVDADMAAPIAGALAVQANVAAPIDASVAANVASFGSTAIAVSHQESAIVQTIDGNATAEAVQTADIIQ